MNRFDRVTSILILLQSKRLITAQDIADRFGVSLRTVYRDIRTLETAGIPILSEAGVGYALDKGYRLPPVMFSQDEAVALLVAEKFIQQVPDHYTKSAYQDALDKIKAVLNNEEKDHLDRLSRRIQVHDDSHRVPRNDPWLHDIQQAISHSHVLAIEYFTHYRGLSSARAVEPIGLYYYSRHWHLIAWCRERDDYRDFRLDRIKKLENTFSHFDRRLRGELTDYLNRSRDQVSLVKVTVIFTKLIAGYTQEQRYWNGFIEEREISNEDGEFVEMDFLVPSLEYLGRWLLTYTNAVRVVQPDEMKVQMQALAQELLDIYP